MSRMSTTGRRLWRKSNEYIIDGESQSELIFLLIRTVIQAKNRTRNGIENTKVLDIVPGRIFPVDFVEQPSKPRRQCHLQRITSSSGRTLVILVCWNSNVYLVYLPLTGLGWTARVVTVLQYFQIPYNATFVHLSEVRYLVTASLTIANGQHRGKTSLLLAWSPYLRFYPSK